MVAGTLTAATAGALALLGALLGRFGKARVPRPGGDDIGARRVEQHLGKAMRAVSFNLDTAKLMGISTDRIISVTFALGSALAAAGGVLIGMQIPKIDPLMGIMYGLKAFVAAVLGGIGNVPGAVLGGLLIGTSEVMVVGYLSSTYRDAIAFGILILVLLLRPQGILGRVQKEKV